MKIGEEIYNDNGVTITWKHQPSLREYLKNMNNNDFEVLYWGMMNVNNELSPYKMRNTLKQNYENR